MVPMTGIVLTDVDKQKLEVLAQTAPDLFIRRARLILAYAEGKPTLLAAMQAGISRGRARYWKRQFLSKGMNVFPVRPAVVPGEEGLSQRLYAMADNLPTIDVGVKQIEGENPPVLDIPYPSPLEAIGIKADDSLSVAGKKVWLYHFALMLSHEQGTRLGEDVEELHDMRVATRRMRTAFDVFGEAFNPKIMKHYLKGLRGIGRALGQVRDMDVILHNGLSYQSNLDEQARPGLEPLIVAWEKMIEKKRLKLIKHLEDNAYDSFKRNFNEFLQAPDQNLRPDFQGSETTNRIRDIVPVLIYGRYAAVKAFENILPTATVSQLHALRIEFKKLRYTLEYFREILGESAGKLINEIKQYQDHLGELHDADVGCQLVKDFLNSWDDNQIQQPITERINPEPIVSYLAYLHAERYKLMAVFPPLWQKFSRPEFRHHLAQAISLL